MLFTLARWRPRHLLTAWIAYWIGLAAVTLGRPIAAAWPLISDPSSRGTVSAGFGDLQLHLTIVEGSTTLYSASAHLVTCALWVAVPPLLLWAAWLARRPRVDRVPVGAPRAS